MAKRFTDTEKWKKKWLRALKAEYKLFWVFICDDCNHAGIWDVDMDVANIRLGTSFTEKEILDAFNEKIISIDDGNKWFVPKFVDFQYGELNPDNRVHNSVINLLSKEGAYKGLINPLQRVKDKDKVKVKIKNKEKTNIYINSFDDIWKRYPNKDGRKEAKRHFEATVRSEQEWTNINAALNNYLDSKRVKDGFIKNGSAWFNGWQDWVEYQEKVCPECKGKGKFTSKTGFEIICKCPAGK